MQSALHYASHVVEGLVHCYTQYKLFRNKHPMRSEAQLACKCLFTRTFLGGGFDY